MREIDEQQRTAQILSLEHKIAERRALEERRAQAPRRPHPSHDPIPKRDLAVLLQTPNPSVHLMVQESLKNIQRNYDLTDFAIQQAVKAHTADMHLLSGVIQEYLDRAGEIYVDIAQTAMSFDGKDTPPPHGA